MFSLTRPLNTWCCCGCKVATRMNSLDRNDLSSTTLTLSRGSRSLKQGMVWIGQKPMKKRSSKRRKQAVDHHDSELAK
ncbi:hypothetical protein GN956_G14132 [Arapaima gigas]